MSRLLSLLLLSALAVGCDPDKPDPDPEPEPDTDTADPDTDTAEPEPEVDDDDDGFIAEEDCDDNNAAVNPGAEEVCDGIDNDCDGTADVDASDATQWFTDSDGDDYGNDGDSWLACDGGDAASQGGDCDDATDWIHPDAEEMCLSAEIDTDCDPSTHAEGRITWVQGGAMWDATDTFSGTAQDPAQISITDDVTVYACQNTWYANFVIEQSHGLTVIGPYGAEDAVFHGGESGSVFLIEGEGDTGLTLDEVTVTGGAGTSLDLYSNTAGGGIFCRGDETSTVDVRASTILENSASVAAGVYGDGCSITIAETVITDHEGSYSSGIIVENGADLLLSEVAMARNTMTGSSGGALEVVGAEAVLEDVEFTDNTIYDIYLNDGEATYSYSELGSGVWLTCGTGGCE